MIDYEIRHHFAEYASQQMLERDIRPWYVAYYAETSETFLRSCLKKKKLPTIASLIMISELFECSINELLGFDYVDVEQGRPLFDSGRDSRAVAEFFMHQLSMRGFDAKNIVYDEPDMEEKFARALRFRRLPETDVFLKICESLNCTPSELLGY